VAGGKEGEREKPKDFNTNNLQGVFCKQNGGHRARSTCLSALTLIVWGRRRKKIPLAACAAVCLCPSSCTPGCRCWHGSVGAARRHGACEQGRGCRGKASPRTQTCRVPAPHPLCFPHA